MTISAQSLANTIREFRHINFVLSDEYMELMAANLNTTQRMQKSIYETNWNDKIARINMLIESEQDFGTMVRTLIQPTKSDNLFTAEANDIDLKYDLGKFQNTSGMTLCAFDGQYRLVDQNYIDLRLIDCLKENLTSDVDTVVEFGAGWGKNLSLLLMSSGRSDVKYMACEQSESGQQSFERLFGLLDGLEFSSHPFDFYTPDFSMLKGKNHVLAFTSAAIEQIAFLPSTFLDGLLEVAEKVTLVFYEPIGWQRSIERINFVIKTVVGEFGGQVPPEKWHGKNFVFKFDDHNFLDNAASWSIYGKYNINLLNMIEIAIEEKRVRQLDRQYDIYSENPLNPYSLIVLEKWVDDYEPGISFSVNQSNYSR